MVESLLPLEDKPRTWCLYGLLLCLIAALLASSYISLRRTEAISFYTSARNYIAHGQTDQGISQPGPAERWPARAARPE